MEVPIPNLNFDLARVLSGVFIIFNFCWFRIKVLIKVTKTDAEINSFLDNVMKKGFPIEKAFYFIHFLIFQCLVSSFETLHSWFLKFVQNHRLT